MVFSTRIITIMTIWMLLQVAVWAAACEPGYNDTITIRAFNNQNVLMRDVQVNLTYQLDQTSGKGYFTATRLTNENGTATFKIHNLEILPESVDCNINIRVQFDDQSQSATVTANAHTTPVDFFLSAYPLTVRVLDQNDRPIGGAEVFVQNRTALSDKNGLANFMVGEGKVRILVKYDIGKVEQEVEVHQPLLQTIGFAFYTLRILAIDDNGQPLAAQVTVADQIYEAPNGTLEIPKVAKSKPMVVVRHDDLERTLEVDLAVQSNYTAVFDSAPPRLVDVKLLPTPGTNRIRLGMTVVDDGKFATGVRPDGITVSYRYNTGDWQTARAYSVTLNQYGVDLLPPKEVGAILFFQIEAEDKDSNRATFEGQLRMDYAPPAFNQTNATNRTNASTPPSSVPAPSGPELPLPIIGGIAAIAIAIYLVYRFKLSRGGATEG